MKSFKNSSILITGGTGSFGNELVNQICKKKLFKRVVIYSRDELKQSEMKIKFPEKKYKFLRFFIGDIRDQARLARAMEGIDIVIHAAALKQVPTAEYNPFEVIKTNVIGAQNVIEAAINSKVKKVIALSTDKASSPINLYGATKLCSDKLFIAANNFRGSKNISLSVVRYGNVMGSRGSVIPIFLDQSKNKEITITSKDMTRFNITLSESVDLVLWSIKNTFGAEIVVPKIPSYKITDIAKSICKSCNIKVIGIRPGEKIHEEMISVDESRNLISLKNHYIILQPSNLKQKNYYKNKLAGKFVTKVFSYNSKENEKYLSLDEIDKLIRNLKIEKKIK